MNPDRFFASPSQWGDAEVTLGPDESHHCLRVMRRQVGECVEVFDGEGRWGRGRILSGAREAVRVDLETQGVSDLVTPTITLVVGVPKGKTMEWIVQKSVELGVAAVQPVVTEHTVVRVGEGESARKTGKWQRVALEACKQCGCNVLPEVRAPVPVDAWLRERETGASGFLASLGVHAVPFREAIGNLPDQFPGVELLIGPEGDFSDEESEAAIAAGFLPVTFGGRVLRVETAVMFGLSVLNYELRD